ncbi:AAA family ATPase [Clostridium sp. NSJ-6]|uniref:AAA family ATPase n=1 Tax=Clostridium hominis TaxID=2763036 RepID=A0ABR7DG86_9CLOT|nr:AAA family ATPase [Clostridium hominis]MBC5630452.1 AAA family ATPase [Clostridium hominis]MDU2670831.1 AAA family ATPase [Clostridium sp.]
MEVSRELNDVIIQAFNHGKKNKDTFITAEHLLYALTFNKSFIDAVNNCDGDINSLRNNLEEYINEYVDEGSDDIPQESYSFQEVLIRASQQALYSQRDKINIEHIVAAFYDLEESYCNYYLIENGIEKTDILYSLAHRNDEDILEDNEELIIEDNDEEVNDKEEKKKSIIDKLTINITEIAKSSDEPLVGREDILERTIQILCRKGKNNPLHIGEPGVGKTAITLGLARLINEGKVPEKLKDSVVLSLDLGSLVAGTKYRGDFEEKIKKVLDEIKTLNNPIVYIDEIHNLVGAGALGGGSLDASNLLKPYLIDGSIMFIGATTYEEYKKYFQKDKGLSRRFQVVEVKEPSEKECIEILNGVKEAYENYHNVKYTEAAIKAAVTLSHKYINDKFLPDKAIDLIDEAGAFINLNSSNSERIIDENIIEDVISKICHIPKKTVEKDEINSLKNLEEDLKKNIFGQDTAIEEVVRTIKMSRAGLTEADKPVASLLFVGPTGVGKTEIARTLSNSLGVKLIRFDMSEYQEKHAASKLIGAPPGYVGYEEGGLLTDEIKKNPHSVLLLDEIEKAHIDILNVLLQVMDYATLSDNQGRKADFRNVIIIMTSNAGAKDIGKSLVGFGAREIKGTAIMEEVKKVFSPEFRNRLDKIVVFNHIDIDIAKNIVVRELEKFKEQLLSKNISIDFSEDAIIKIAEKGTSKEFGAREIKRIINSDVKPLLVDEILFGSLSKGGICTVKVEDNQFKI